MRAMGLNCVISLDPRIFRSDKTPMFSLDIVNPVEDEVIENVYPWFTISQHFLKKGTRKPCGPGVVSDFMSSPLAKVQILRA
jgi:hypothetical protein